MLLRANQLDDDVKKALAVAFCANTTAEHGIEPIEDDFDVIDVVDDEVDENENDKPIINVEDFEGSELISHPQHNQSTSEQHSSSAEAGSKIQNSNLETESEIQRLLEDLLIVAYENDEVVKGLIAAREQGLRKIPPELAKQGIKLAMGDLTVEGSGTSKRLYLRSRMYVPNNENLQLFLLQQHHNPPTHGHPGFKTMLRKLQENWFWIGMANHCKQYAVNCATCRRSKGYNAKK